MCAQAYPFKDGLYEFTLVLHTALFVHVIGPALWTDGAGSLDFRSRRQRLAPFNNLEARVFFGLVLVEVETNGCEVVVPHVDEVVMAAVGVMATAVARLQQHVLHQTRHLREAGQRVPHRVLEKFLQSITGKYDSVSKCTRHYANNARVVYAEVLHSTT